MKKCSRKKKKLIFNCILFALVTAALAGCGDRAGAGQEEGQMSAGELQTDGMQGKPQAEDIGEEVQTDGLQNDDVRDVLQADGIQDETTMTGIAGESAADAEIDFSVLEEENPDIFAWIYIPGTTIDCPVLQSEQADDFYEDHNAYGQPDDAGAVYIELANLASMCDFNTVLHGKTGADEKGLFADLYQFADPDFFEEHETIYLYMDGNVLTYEVFAAYERENTSLLRTYDFTYLEGCERFLEDLYGTRDMTMNLRDGWEGVTPYHFLITLTTQKEDEADRQFVVIAILTQDAAGAIDRIVAE